MKQDLKDIDLYSAYLRKINEEDPNRPLVKKHVIFGGFLAVIILAAVGGCSYLALRKSELTERLNNLNVVYAAEQYSESAEKHRSLVADNEHLSEKYAQVSTQLAPLIEKDLYSEFSSDLFLCIQAQCRNVIVLTDITVTDHELMLEFSTNDVSEMSMFIDRLRNDGLFTEIEYNGYAESSGRYVFSLLCSLSERGGVADE